MTDVFSIGVSGLQAQQQRLATSASNIANATTVGKVPDKNAPGASTVYKPLTAVLSANVIDGQPGGVRSDIIESKDGYSLVFSPDSPYANEQGLIAVPNIDLARESVNVMVSKTLFKADVAVIKTEKEMQEELLDILA